MNDNRITFSDLLFFNLMSGTFILGVAHLLKAFITADGGGVWSFVLAMLVTPVLFLMYSYFRGALRKERRQCPRQDTSLP